MIKNIWSLILIIGILAGQLVKFPQSTQGGVTILDISIILLVVYGLVQVKTKIITPPGWIKASLVFFAAAVISLILTPLNLSLSQYLISSAYPLRFLLYFLFGWLVLSGGIPSIRQSIPQIIVISGVGLATLGLLQLIFIPSLGFMEKDGWDPHYFRTASTLLDPNFLGAYLVLTLLVLIQKVNFLTTKSSVGCFFLTYFALITTFSRSAAIMFGVSFLTLTLLKKSPRMLILTALLAFGFGVSFLIYQQIVAKPKNIDRGQSAAYRISSWEQGWTTFQSSPIFGVGFNTYRFALKEYHLASDNFISSRGASGSDSSLLFIAAASGIIGFAAYLGLIIAWIKTALKRNSSKIWGAIAISGLLGLMIHSLFINSLFYPWILLWIVLVGIQITSENSLDTTG